MCEGSEKKVGCRLVRDGCRSIWCPTCGPGQGLRLRHRLMERYRVRQVTRVGFATLTCSPAILGEDLEGQFTAVKEQRLVARFVWLFRKITGQRGAYLSVMEFHKQSRQVHFHLVLDGCGKLPRAALVQLQAWCQEHMGTFDYKYMPSDRAIGYCLKYVTKGAYDGLPDWCLDFDGRIRAYSTSRGFWHDGKPRLRSEESGATRKQQTLRVRFERCEHAGVVGMTESVDDEGAVRRHYAFSSPVPFETLRTMAAAVVEDEGGARVDPAGAAGVFPGRGGVRGVGAAGLQGFRGAGDGPPRSGGPCRPIDLVLLGVL